MSRSTTTFLDLPPEILSSILLLVSPQDVSAVSRTCTQLHFLIEHDSLLWRRLFLDRWDLPSSLTAVASDDFDFADVLKERAGAMARVQRGADDHLAKLLRYNSVIRTLLAAVRDSKPKQRPPGSYNVEGPRSASIDTLKRLFSYDEAGEKLFSEWIYPRETVSAYAAWKETGADMNKAAGNLRVVEPQRRGEGTEGENVMAVEGRAEPSSKKRRGNARRVSSPRRSRRLLKASLPDDLRHLFDQDPSKTPHDIWDLDRMDSPLDEETAAELHCLHGARYWHRDIDRINLSERDALLGRQAQGDDLNEDERQKLEALLIELPLDPAEYDHRERAAPVRGGRRSEGSLELGSRDGAKGNIKLRGRARGRIYNCQRFGFENAWGPFKPFRAREEPEAQPGEADDDAEVDETDGGAAAAQIVEQEVPSITEPDAEMESDSDDGDVGPIPIAVSLDDDDDDDSDDSSFVVGDSDIEVQEGSDDDLITGDIQLEAPTTDEEEDDEEDFAGILGPGFGPIDDDGNIDGEVFFRSLLDVLAKVMGRRVTEATKRQRAEADAGRGPKWEEGIDPATGLKRWRSRKQVDWLVVEAAMVLTHANVMAVAAKEWGIGLAVARSIPARFGWPSDRPRVDDDRRNLRRALWSVMPPSGWGISRREIAVDRSPDQEEDEGEGATLAIPRSPAIPAPPPPARAKPIDWARIEGTWLGTYFFLDYSNFLMHNALRGCMEHDDVGWPAGMRRPTSASAISLEKQAEATGELLCFELELRPLDEQKPEFEEGEEEAWYEGPEDPEFPSLRFVGRTVQYIPSGVRTHSQIHGLVRPVREVVPAKGAQKEETLGAVTAIHFTMTHTYEGEDRWRVEAIQAGPPGSRSPLFGVWTDKDHEGASPTGPTTYWRADDRPPREIDELLKENPVDPEAALLRLAAHLGMVR